MSHEQDLFHHDTGPTPELEPDPRNAALPAHEVEKRTGLKFLVRVVSIRTRLIDEDNLCEKYHIDLLRYAGIISGDEAGKTKIETIQRKAAKGETERVEITVTYL